MITVHMQQADSSG